MTTSIILALIWFVVANIVALLPSKSNHWNQAYVLIAIGVPLLGYVTYENGPLVGLVCFAAGVSVLRWPMIFLGRWFRTKLARSEA